MELQEFQQIVRDFSELDVVRRHIIFGECAIVDADKYYDIRSIVASEFRIHPNSVVIVGSAKLGFSIAPTKRYREFCDESDIDIAIVAPELFDNIWREADQYQRTGTFWPEKKAFFRVLGNGWIRPDKLPRSTLFTLRNRWFDFFQKIDVNMKFGQIQIRAGLYKDWYFLERYQTRAVSSCSNPAFPE